MIKIPEPFATLDLEWRPNDLTWRQVLRNDPCAYCGAPCEEIDHIQPRSANGLNDPANLAAACKRCNRSKNYRSLLAFLSGQPVGHRRAIEWSRDPARKQRFAAAEEQRKLAQAEWERSERRYHEHMRLRALGLVDNPFKRTA